MLRGFGVPHIYGLPGLKGKDKDKVRLGTLLAVRVAQAARAFHARRLPWNFETPARWSEQPSVFELPEVKALDALPGVSTCSIVQCELGAVTTKPTELKGN
eukprot:15982843-Heterocapsa_arctica.AAC.1